MLSLLKVQLIYLTVQYFDDSFMHMPLDQNNKNVTRNLTVVYKAKGTNFAYNLQDIKPKNKMATFPRFVLSV
jgi:hypothetical protein